MATLVLPKMPPAANKPGVLSFKAVMPPAFAVSPHVLVTQELLGPTQPSTRN